MVFFVFSIKLVIHTQFSLHSPYSIFPPICQAESNDKTHALFRRNFRNVSTHPMLLICRHRTALWYVIKLDFKKLSTAAASTRQVLLYVWYNWLMERTAFQRATVLTAIHKTRYAITANHYEKIVRKFKACK